MKEWFSAIELSGIEGMPGTKMNVIRKAKKEKWLFREVKAKGGPGGKKREYHISSLPEETRIALLKMAASIQTPDDAAMQEFIEKEKIKLTPEELQDETILAKINCARLVKACPFGDKEKLIGELAKKYKKSRIQIRRWIEDVDKLKIRTVHKITVGKEQINTPEARSFSPEALALGISAYAHDMKAGIKPAYNKIIEYAQQRGEPTGDYSTFTRIIKKIPQSIWLRIRSGQTGFELNGLPKIIREWTAIPVQTVLCGDQKIFDYVIYDPETDDLILPEGYIWMDCSSRMINGVWIEFGHYNQFTVSQSLREALRYGIPEEIYTDWGKAEGAKHITDVRQRLSGFCTTDDFVGMYDKYGNLIYPDHRKAQPGKPWVKPIENIMNIIEQKLVARNLPGYRKRDKNTWINKEQQDLLKKQASQGVLLTVEQFVSTVFEVIDEHNREEKSLKEGKDIVPIDFFIENFMKAPRTVFDDRTLDFLCLPRFVRKPHQARVRVTVRGEERGYYSPVLSARKEPVTIYVDPYDKEAPAILTEPEDGSFLDIAEAWNVQNPYDTEGLARKRARQQELMKWVNEQARRIKSGFDLYKSPEIKEKTPIKVSQATQIAKKAEEEKKIYVLNREAQRQELENRKKEAVEAQKELIKEFEEAKNQPINPWGLPEGRERFFYYMKLKKKIENNEAITDLDAWFFERYPHTRDYRICNDLYMQYGKLYYAEEG